MLKRVEEVLTLFSSASLWSIIYGYCILKCFQLHNSKLSSRHHIAGLMFARAMEICWHQVVWTRMSRSLTKNIEDCQNLWSIQESQYIRYCQNVLWSIISFSLSLCEMEPKRRHALQSNSPIGLQDWQGHSYWILLMEVNWHYQHFCLTSGLRDQSAYLGGFNYKHKWRFMKISVLLKISKFGKKVEKRIINCIWFLVLN